VHELLLEAGPPPELPPTLARAPAPRPASVLAFPQRWRSAALGIAAAALLGAFFVGYAVGHQRDGGFTAVRTAPPMVGVGPVREARAQIELGAADSDGNWDLQLRVTGLPELPKGDYYTLYLSRGDRPLAPCGTFKVGTGRLTTVQMNVGYDASHFDGWVVTREQPRGKHPGPVIMVTRV
jgi:hypothetical protein